MLHAVVAARRLALPVFAALSLLAASADATPVRYDYVTGVASFRLVQGQTVLGADTAALVGTFATFDAAAPALTDLEFVIDDGAVTLGPLGSIDVTLTATDAPGFSAPATPLGGGVYSWSGGGVDVVGSLSFTGGLLAGQTVPVNLFLPSLNGNFRTASTATETFGLANAFNVYFFTLGGVQYHVQASVAFKGEAVPEPASALLVAAGLAAIARPRRR